MRARRPALGHLLNHIHTRWEQKQEERHRSYRWVAGVSSVLVFGIYLGTMMMVRPQQQQKPRDHEILSLMLPEPPHEDSLTAAAASVPLMELKVDRILAAQVIKALPALAYALSRGEANTRMLPVLGGNTNTWVVVAAVAYSVVMFMCK